MHLPIVSYASTTISTTKTQIQSTLVSQFKPTYDKLATNLRRLEQMQNKALILEAYHTTHSEGTQLTLHESEQLWQGQHLSDVNPDDVRELLNYRQAFELVSGYVSNDDPITEGLVREIHKQLVQQVRGNSATPGLYRKIQNYVVNSKTQEVIYTPPPVYEITPMMQELIDWLNQEEAIHPVLVSGIAQFQLVHIHPFLDGNGRTGRLLSTLCLYRKGYDFKKLFTISEYYDRNRTDYYQAIQSVRKNSMNMTKWLEYFSETLAIQLHEIKELGAKVIQQSIVMNQYHLSDRQKLAINYMTTEGCLSIQKFVELCPDISRRTLQRDIKNLIDNGIVTSSGTTNDMVYSLKEK